MTTVSVDTSATKGELATQLLNAKRRAVVIDEAGLAVYRSWTRVQAASNVGEFATAVEQMHDTMSQFTTWLPGYDYETGTVLDEEG